MQTYLAQFFSRKGDSSPVRTASIEAEYDRAAFNEARREMGVETYAEVKTPGGASYCIAVQT